MFVWADAQSESGAFYADSKITTVNNPIPGTWLFGTLFRPIGNSPFMQVIEPYSGRTFLARKYSLAWQPWIELATAKPPQKYNLPLVEGIAGYIDYSNSQDGHILLSGYVSKNFPENDLPQGLLGILPDGFRPTSEFAMPCVCDLTTNGAVKHAANIHLMPDGEIYLYTDGGEMVRGALICGTYLVAT